MNNSLEWIEVDVALRLLEVKRETLYAYVSRGFVRSKPLGGRSRASLYALPDVNKMAAKRRRPRKRAEVAAGTIKWGEPILETGISTVQDGQLLFGDRDACELANTFSLEDIARHHWRADQYIDVLPLQSHIPAKINPNPKVRAFEFLAQKAGVGQPILGRSRESLAAEAASLLSGFADAVLGQSYDAPIHDRLGNVWRLTPQARHHVRRALVLISDHELNASTFSVRIAASTGASLAACMAAGLAALSGPLHGGATQDATHFLERAITHTRTGRPIDTFLKDNADIPGMGHPLYPSGDIRTKSLLGALRPSSEILDILKAFEQHSGAAPNVDMGHAALACELGLPEHAGFVLFALGRMSGWLAHAIEQNESGQLIRPRALFRRNQP